MRNYLIGALWAKGERNESTPTLFTGAYDLHCNECWLGQHHTERHHNAVIAEKNRQRDLGTGTHDADDHRA